MSVCMEISEDFEKILIRKLINSKIYSNLAKLKEYKERYIHHKHH